MLRSLTKQRGGESREQEGLWFGWFLCVVGRGEGRGQWAEREEVAGSSVVLGTYAFKGSLLALGEADPKGRDLEAPIL